MASRVAVVDDPLFAEHRADGAHPERPERLEAARRAVTGAELSSARIVLDARDASDDELERVHGADYLEDLSRAAGDKGWFDADTYYAPRSVDAARRAAGGAIALVDALTAQKAEFGVAL